MLSCTIDGIFVSRLRIKTSTLLLVIGWSKIIIYRFPDNQRGDQNISTFLYRITYSSFILLTLCAVVKYYSTQLLLHYAKDKRKVIQVFYF